MTEQDTGLSDDMAEKATAFKDKVHETFGAIIVSLAQAARYKHLPLGELTSHLLEPLVRDRVITAVGTSTERPGVSGLAGLAIWASVSDDVDEKIKNQIKAGVFPIRLGPSDWASGSNVWVLDVVAGDAQTASSIIAKLQAALPEGEMQLHPIVAKQMSSEALSALGGTKEEI